MTTKKYPDYLCDENGELIELPPPVPVPNEETYQRVRQEALAFSERRRQNYEKYKASAARERDIDFMPTRIDIENVSRCNFRCTMCSVSDWPKGMRARDMTLEEFKNLINEQYGLVEVKIQGLGEPTMQGDTFFEMIRYARSKKIWVRVVTNASLLHLKDNYKKLVDSGVNEIQISIDGATKEVYEGIRRGSKFEQVVENCKLINGYCAEKGIERTKMWTVVQTANQHQVPDIVRLGAEMGFKHMAFSLNLIDFGLQEWKENNAALSVEKIFTNRQAVECMELGESLGVTTRFWRQTHKYDTDKPENLCPWPFERGYVSSDMRVVPCCILGNPDVAELGPADDFTKTWQSETWQDFRQAHLDGNIPDVCKLCYRAEGDEE